MPSVAALPEWFENAPGLELGDVLCYSLGAVLPRTSRLASMVLTTPDCVRFALDTSSTRWSAMASLACILELFSARWGTGQFQSWTPGVPANAAAGSEPERALPAPCRVSTTAVPRRRARLRW